MCGGELALPVVRVWSLRLSQSLPEAVNCPAWLLSHIPVGRPCPSVKKGTDPLSMGQSSTEKVQGLMAAENTAAHTAGQGRGCF